MIAIGYYGLIAVGLNLLLFIPAYIFKTDKLTDLSYALTFMVLVWISVLVQPFSWVNVGVALMISVWALRLGVFLVIRIGKMKRDKRFDGVRESFPRFLRFWVLQGLIVWVILLPALFFASAESQRVFWQGMLVWLLGVVIEHVSDVQKYRFNQKKENKGKFIQEGLWRYSRHPNYFGEILCWIGVYLTVFLSLTPLERVFGLFSPVGITLLLVFVTGLPPLENYADSRWGTTKEYQKYKRQTSILIPWFQRR